MNTHEDSTVSAEQLRSVLTQVSSLASRRGLGEEEHDELIAMLTPSPEHITAA